MTRIHIALSLNIPLYLVYAPVPFTSPAGNLIHRCFSPLLCFQGQIALATITGFAQCLQVLHHCFTPIGPRNNMVYNQERPRLHGGAGSANAAPEIISSHHQNLIRHEIVLDVLCRLIAATCRDSMLVSLVGVSSGSASRFSSEATKASSAFLKDPNRRG